MGIRKNQQPTLERNILRAACAGILAVCAFLSALGLSAAWGRVKEQTRSDITAVSLEAGRRLLPCLQSEDGLPESALAGIGGDGTAPGCYAFLADADGRILAHPDKTYGTAEKEVTLRRLGEAYDPLAEALRQGKTGELLSLKRTDGQRFYYVCTAIPGGNRYIVAAYPAKNEAAALRWAVFWTFLAFAVSAGTGIWVCRWACRRYIRPLSQAADAAIRTAAGGACKSCPEIPRNSSETAGLLDAIEVLGSRSQACFRTVEDNLRRMAEGNFVPQAQCGSPVNCPGICETLEETAQQLRGSMGSVRSAFEQLSGQFAALERDVAAFSKGDELQRQTQDALEQALDALSGQLARQSEDIRRVNCLADALCRQAADYGRQLEKLVEAANQVDICSAEADKVVRAMEDAAFQSSMLARTAYVEAARAGVGGKGFAVVASELRILAARGAQSAQDAGAMLEELHRMVKENVALTSSAANDFRAVQSGGERIYKETGLAAADVRREEELSEVARRVRQLEHITENSQSLSHDSLKAIRSLRQRIDKLRESLRTFRLS